VRVLGIVTGNMEKNIFDQWLDKLNSIFMFAIKNAFVRLNVFP